MQKLLVGNMFEKLKKYHIEPNTPQETLAHRRARGRDGKLDSPFTTTVLNIEQEMLHRQAKKAQIIVAKSGELLDYAAYERLMQEEQ